MQLLTKVGNLLLYAVPSLAAGCVGLFFERFMLHLQLPNTTIQGVDLGGSTI